MIRNKGNGTINTTSTCLPQKTRKLYWMLTLKADIKPITYLYIHAFFTMTKQVSEVNWFVYLEDNYSEPFTLLEGICDDFIIYCDKK